MKSRKALSAFTATRAEGRGDAHGCGRVGVKTPTTNTEVSQECDP